MNNTFKTTVTINAEQRLYVKHTAPILKSGKLGTRGAFYTCHGFDNALESAKKVAKWLGVPMPTGEVGTVAWYEAYQALMAQGAAYSAATGKRCEADLTPKLKGFEGKRVEVTYKDGTTARFKVGRSTGWMPIHLEIATQRSTGGCGVMGQIKAVRELEPVTYYR